jgi:hypothetical protein
MAVLLLLLLLLLLSQVCISEAMARWAHICDLFEFFGPFVWLFALPTRGQSRKGE